jgi:protoheme IX farnesyltransferase
MTKTMINATTSPEATASSPAARGGEGSTRDYFELLKPRVMSLVVFSGFAGLMAAPGHIHPLLGFTAILCIALASGAAGAINMWYERDLDALMKRTRDRPLPAGRVAPDDALAMGLFLTACSVGLMALAINWVAAAILAFASFFYVIVYTVGLKRHTPQNIVIGGAAGAFPPMIGWAAVTGDVSWASLTLFLIIFLWTPPHFWALALFSNEDYRRAGVPMLPVVAGERHTKWQMLAYTLVLAPVALLPTWLGTAGMVYLTFAAVLGGLFILAALRVLREDGAATNHKAARQMFGYSILYLFAIFAALIVDATARGL